MKMKFQQTALNMVMFLALGVGVTACGGGDGSSGESQGGWAESYNKAMSQRKLNSEGYKNTQKLNEKQKDFLLKVMDHGRYLSQIMQLCYQKERDLNKCHDEKKGSSGKVSFGKHETTYDTKYISNITVPSTGEIEIKASSYFGDNVTLILSCEPINEYQINRERAGCPISSKSTCLEKGLCFAGVFDLGETIETNPLYEVEFKIKE